MAQLRQHYLTCRVGDQWYGLNIADVIEVTFLVILTELPATTPDMLGLITVREQVMPVIDLRRRFSADEALLKMDTPIITVQTARGPIGLVVDEAEDVVPVEEANLSGYDGAESRYVEGVVRLSDRLLLILDAARLRMEVHESDLPEQGEDTPVPVEATAE